MKNHYEVGHFKYRLMMVLLSLFALIVTAGQSFAATTCSTCHGMPPLDSADGTRNPATGAFKGSHQTHVSPAGAVAECNKCHNSSGHTNSHAATDGYNISLASNIYSSPSTAKYSKGTSFPTSPTPILGTCRNVSCHFESPTPTWGKAPAAAPATDCNMCHATPRGNSGSHLKHEAMVVAGVAYNGINACSQCHPYYGFGSYSTTASESKFSHATSVGRHKIVTKSFLTYSGGSLTSVLPSQPNNYGSCRATQCHDTGRDNPRTAVWSTTKASCTACHALEPATFSHTKHLTGLTGSFKQNAVCGDCHKGYVKGSALSATPADHIDGNVDVYFATPGDLGYPVNKAKGTAVGSCSTSNCHSSGASVFKSATWGGISTGCDFCHPIANLSAGHIAHVGSFPAALKFYSYTANKSSGTSYTFGCGSCHPNSVSSHLDGIIEVDLVPAVAGGSLKAKNLSGATINGSKKCNNIYCHSNGYSANFKCITTLAWTDKFINYTAASKGSKDKCAWCHGNSPNSNATRIGSPAHTAHVVGIHFDDIFNGVSKKLPISGPASVNAAHGKDSRSTTINCNICHAATMTTSANDKNTNCVGCHVGSYAKNPVSLISDTSKHVNGTVDVAFAAQKISTKAQVVNSSFAAYTANSSGWTRRSNAMSFKTYTSSYDTTKNTLASAASPYTPAAGCLNIACHASISVKWTDTVSCSSCHTRLK
ncbi:MAG: CxxxxCH/CxxCH domain-containing protein [Geobacteraceae bacterium]|nr:CxxxxCH/CxxCH domain-containing protein [Geobacteraceae bacterium]